MTIEEQALDIAQDEHNGDYKVAQDKWRAQVGRLSQSKLRELKESIEKHERLLKKYG